MERRLSKTRVSEGTDQGRTPAYCLAAPRSCHGLVYARRQEEVVEVTDSCFEIIKSCFSVSIKFES